MTHTGHEFKTMKKLLTLIFAISLLSTAHCRASNVSFGWVDMYGNPLTNNFTLTLLNQPLSYGNALAYSPPQNYYMTASTMTVSNLIGGNYVLGVEGYSKLQVLTVPPNDTNTWWFTSLICSNTAYYARLGSVFLYWPTNLDAWSQINPMQFMNSFGPLAFQGNNTTVSNSQALGGQLASDPQNDPMTSDFVRKPGFNAYPTPVSWYDTWANYGPGVNETNVLQEITNIVNNPVGFTHLFPEFFIMLDAGVISSNLDSAGLLNINTNTFPGGWARVINAAHYFGLKIAIMLQSAPSSGVENGSFTLPNDTNATWIYQCATNLARQGLDGFRIDGASVSNFLAFDAAWMSATTNNNVWAGVHSTDFFIGETNLYTFPPNSYVNYEPGGEDFPAPYEVFHGSNTYSGAVGVFTGEEAHQSPGRLLNPIEVQNAGGEWPQGQNDFNFACMFSGDILFDRVLWANADDVAPSADAVQVDFDQLRYFPTIVTNSTTNFDVLVKPLSDGGCALLLANYNTNTAYSFTVDLTKLVGVEIASNEPVAVEDLNFGAGTNVENWQYGTNEASMPAQWTWATNSVTLIAHKTALQTIGQYSTFVVWPFLRLWKEPPIAAYASLFPTVTNAGLVSEPISIETRIQGYGSMNTVPGFAGSSGGIPTGDQIIPNGWDLFPVPDMVAFNSSALMYGRTNLTLSASIYSTNTATTGSGTQFEVLIETNGPTSSGLYTASLPPVVFNFQASNTLNYSASVAVPHSVLTNTLFGEVYVFPYGSPFTSSNLWLLNLSLHN